MTERTYTESELRERLNSAAREIGEAVDGRLRDDGFPRLSAIPLTTTLRDGGWLITIDGDGFARDVHAYIRVVLQESVNSIMTALFEE